METPKPIDGFDCVQMKREGAERIYEAIKDLTEEQRQAYWMSLYEKHKQPSHQAEGVRLAS